MNADRRSTLSRHALGLLPARHERSPLTVVKQSYVKNAAVSVYADQPYFDLVGLLGPKAGQ